MRLARNYEPKQERPTKMLYHHYHEGDTYYCICSVLDGGVAITHPKIG